MKKLEEPIGEWKVKNKIPISKLSIIWCNTMADLAQPLKMCSIRGDDIYNTNQIVINRLNNISKSITDKRKRFGFLTKINVEQIEVYDILSEKDRLILVIEKL